MGTFSLKDNLHDISSTRDDISSLSFSRCRFLSLSLCLFFCFSSPKLLHNALVFPHTHNPPTNNYFCSDNHNRLPANTHSTVTVVDNHMSEDREIYLLQAIVLLSALFISVKQWSRFIAPVVSKTIPTSESRHTCQTDTKHLICFHEDRGSNKVALCLASAQVFFAKLDSNLCVWLPSIICKATWKTSAAFFHSVKGKFERVPLQKALKCT